MNSQVTLNLPAGKIGFASSVLGWDEEPCDAFRVELQDLPTMYGEWRAKFADNENDFNVEIVSIGYVNKRHLRSPYPAHRKRFSAQQGNAVEELIHSLFADEAAKAGLAPFASQKARFLGDVSFIPGWILRSA
jgi:hypothetical protein